MKTASAKAKGRRLQQHVRDEVLKANPELTPDDVRSTSMGAGGRDILLSPVAQHAFPFSVECKNTEKINVWSAIEQAEDNAGLLKPLVVFKRNNSDVYAVIRFEDLIELLKSPRS